MGFETKCVSSRGKGESEGSLRQPTQWEPAITSVTFLLYFSPAQDGEFSEAQNVYASQSVCARNRVLGDWCDKVLLAELDLLVGLGWGVGG